MGENVKLSILTPAVPSRISRLAELSKSIEKQTGNLPIEHLVLMDNKRRTIGEKRDALLRSAIGDYVAFVDDDDEIMPGYVENILAAIQSKPDVATFRQLAIYKGQSSEVRFNLGAGNGPFVPDGITQRDAWHVCAWRRSLAILSHFPASNYGEDWAYASRLCAISGLRELHIPMILHKYEHNPLTTEAPE